jgi:hypothetical protein
MKIKATILGFTAGLLFLGTVAQGQSVTFAIEKDALKFADGTTISRDASGGDNRSTVSIFGAYLSEAELAAFSTSMVDFNSLVSTNPEQALSTLKTALTREWSPINAAAGIIAGVRDWNGNLGTGLVDTAPVMVVLTAAAPGALTLSDQVGVVTTSYRLTGLAAQVVGFNTANTTWDTALVGQLGSLTLAPVPEPSTYAAMVGLLALGLVMVRRRRK